MNKLTHHIKNPLILYILAISLSVFALGSAFFFQYHENLFPCNLCLAQRFMHYLLLSFTLASLALFSFKWKKTALWLNSIALIFTLLGAGLAGRQFYLQRLADKEHLGCGIDLVSMMGMFAPLDVVKKLLEGSTDCATIDWTLFGLSFADYSLIIFIIIAIIQIKLLIIQKRAT